MSKNNLIKKFNGESALRNNCRIIKGEYYEKNIDCFFINNKWYRINSGYIVYDNEVGSYVVKNDTLVEGVVDFVDNKTVKGYFTPNIFKNVNSRKAEPIPSSGMHRMYSNALENDPIAFNRAQNTFKYNTNSNLFYANMTTASSALDNYFKPYVKTMFKAISVNSDSTCLLRVANSYFEACENATAIHIGDNYDYNSSPYMLRLNSDISKVFAIYSMTKEYDSLYKDISGNIIRDNFEFISTLGPVGIFINEIERIKNEEDDLSDEFYSEFSYSNLLKILFQTNFDKESLVDRIYSIEDYYGIELLKSKEAIDLMSELWIHKSNENMLFSIALKDGSRTQQIYFTLNDFKYLKHFNIGKDFNDFFKESYDSTEVASLVNILLRTTSYPEHLLREALGTSYLDGDFQVVMPNSESHTPEPLNDDLLFLNEEVANKCGYFEVFGKEYFVHKSSLPKDYNKIKTASYKDKLAYNVGEVSKLEDYIKDNFNKYKVEISDKAIQIAELLQGLSFGVEFETSKGYIPVRKLIKLGLIPLRDGSLDGGIEYTTLPLEGAKGIQLLFNMTQELSKYCEINDRCSMHIHIGNVPTTKEFGLAMYMAFKTVQEELFEMNPPYKRTAEWIGSRGKDYCKPLRSLGLFRDKVTATENGLDIIDNTKLKTNFTKLYKFLTENINGDTLPEDISRHPRDGQGKWNFLSRYYALNLINLYFSKYKTVECRLHHPTVNYTKTINWLLIIAGLVNYVKNNTIEVLSCKSKLDLTEVIYKYAELEIDNKEFASNVASYLNSYIVSMKNTFDYYYYIQQPLQSRDFLYEDKLYKFEVDGFNLNL
jgi:hypothetical protein